MSDKSRAKYWRKQNKAQKRNLSRGIAKNSLTLSSHSGQGGRQDRGIGLRPSLAQWQNPFVYGTNAFAAMYAYTMYISDWMAKKAVDIPPQDMFREGWNWLYGGKDTGVDEKLQKECDRLNFRGVMLKCKTMERLVGGCVAVRVTRDGGDTKTPVAPEQIDKGGVVCYNVIPSNHIQVAEWQMGDINALDYGRPSRYTVHGQLYHRSRLLIFDGNPISPFPQLDFAFGSGADHRYAGQFMGSNNGFGNSVLSSVYDAIMMANAYQQDAGHLAKMASVLVVLQKGLIDLKATRQGNRALEEVIHLAESASMYKGAVVDGENVDMKNITASFGSVPELIEGALKIVAAAVDIESSRYLWEFNGGLNANGQSGLEKYYNRIAADQKNDVSPILDAEAPYLVNSAFGRGVVDPAEISHEWIPLWNLTDTEEAQVRTLNTNNVVNIANTFGTPVEWAMEELKRLDVIDHMPDLEKMERQRVLDEITAFQQTEAAQGGQTDNRQGSLDSSASGDMPRLPGGGGGQ
jgi:phage-related protein (TIGR01555 family)